METKKGDRYETKHDEDDLENLAERLTADLRGHIHQLADPKVRARTAHGRPIGGTRHRWTDLPTWEPHIF